MARAPYFLKPKCFAPLWARCQVLKSLDEPKRAAKQSKPATKRFKKAPLEKFSPQATARWRDSSCSRRWRRVSLIFASLEVLEIQMAIGKLRLWSIFEICIELQIRKMTLKKLPSHRSPGTKRGDMPPSSSKGSKKSSCSPWQDIPEANLQRLLGLQLRKSLKL